MNVFKNAFIAFFIAFFSFIALVSCGGEEPKTDNEPTDEEVITDTEPTDDVEPVDNEEPDDIQTDDPEIDEEPTDDDSTAPSCEENPTCQEVCKNFLDKSGHWNRKESDLDPGSIDVTLFVCEDECCLDTTGSKQWSFKSTNRDYPAEFPSPIYFFSLRKTDSETFVVEKKQEKEGETEEVITFIR